MVNEMRDRLVELFKKIEYTPFLGSPSISNLALQFTDYALYSICDDLIENGVIVPPCKVGDHIYYVFGKNASLPFGANRIRPLLVRAVASTEDKKGWFVRVSLEGIVHDFKFSDFGKTVFLTKEQAEQKLKETRGE
jgi:hypothetical protein